MPNKIVFALLFFSSLTWASGDHQHPAPTDNGAVLTKADFNGDGSVTQSDIDELEKHLGSKESDVYGSGTYDASTGYHPLYDLDADLSISEKDLHLAHGQLGQKSSELDQDVALTTKATMKYYGPQGLDNAKKDGYVVAVPDARGMGVHWVSLDRMVGWLIGKKFHADKPEGLLYTADNKLVSLFYVRPVTFLPRKENFYELVKSTDRIPSKHFRGLPDTAWHFHVNVCATGIGTSEKTGDPQLTFDQDLEGSVPMLESAVPSEAEACATQKGRISLRELLYTLQQSPDKVAKGSTVYNGGESVLASILKLKASLLKYFPGKFMDQKTIPNVWPFSDIFFIPKAYMLHGWFHKINPAGRFTEHNNRVSPEAPELPSRHPRPHAH